MFHNAAALHKYIICMRTQMYRETYSLMASMKTEKAKRTVMPKAIFSPESGGRQKTRRVRADSMMQGSTML
jgi:hypothetical protein